MSFTTRITFAAILVGALLMPSLSAQTPQQLFQQALSKEQADGNIDEAIRLYQRVIEAGASDRALTARALLQMGRCYEKLGRDGARKSYERLLQEFADQKDVAAQARARLTALSRGGAGAAVMRTRQLTELQASSKEAWRDLQGLSPDGRTAVLGDYTKGQNLGTYDLRSGKFKLLTDLDWSSHWVCCPAWSPRGNLVAYQRSGWAPTVPVEVFVTSLDGQSRMVFRNDDFPGKGAVPIGWSRDLTRVFIAVGDATGKARIGSVPAEGGPLTLIRSIAWSYEWGGRMSVSPDGALIAYDEREAGGSRDIHVVSVDGSREYRVTDHPADDTRPIWSPNGRYLGFISNRFGSTALWAVLMKGGEPAGAPFKIKDGMEDASPVAWNAHGIVYRQNSTAWDVFTASRNGSTGWSPVRQLPYARTGRNVAATWSPDGTRLAFVSNLPAEESRRNVVVYPAAGGPAREFPIPTTRFGSFIGPSDLRWFGNGQGLGFSGSEPNQKNVVFKLTLATGEWQVTPLDIGLWTRVEWNDDGSAFYYARFPIESPPHGIFEHDLKTGRDRLVYEPEGRWITIRGLKVSPDRKWLAVHRRWIDEEKTENADLIVVNLVTGEHRTLTTVPALRLHGMTWTSEKALALLVSENAAGPKLEMRVVSVDGGAVTVLKDVPLPSGGRGIMGFDLSGDGQRVAYVVRENPADTFIIENPLADAPVPPGMVRR